MINRINKFRDLLKKNNLDAFIIDSRENVFYLTGFTGTSARVVFTPKENYFITDFRYTEQAEEQTDGYKVVEINQDQDKKVCNYLLEDSVNKAGFESEDVSYDLYNTYKKNSDGVELVPCKDMVQKLRIVKENHEINNIKEAVKIADKAFSHIIDFIKPGLTEKEISLELEYFMKKEGGTKNSFDFIVASGKRSSMPHGVASDKIVKKGEFITLDFGTVYQGYCSDITRTIILGKATPRQSKIYKQVLKAQQEVIKQIQPGMTGKEVDEIARGIIDEAGYKENFKHGVGHGLGIKVHEAPRISYKSDEKIKPGMVVTDEPGIYISDWGGVRIEDDLFITENGCEVLNQSKKELIEI